jgi:uncharacterized protein YcbX
MATLTQLVLYPIKSCAGMAVASATLTQSGLMAEGVHDREWMLVTDEGQFLTQREYPRMATIVARPDGAALRVRAPAQDAQDDLLLPLAWTEDAPTRTVRIWDDLVDAVDCGDGAAAWFGAMLGVRCRLVRFRRDAVRPTSVKWTKGVPSQTRFADGYPLLLIGQASLDDLNARLAAAGRAALPMDRFRPNLVVEGIAAYEEDYVGELRAELEPEPGTESAGGAVAIRPVKPCARCPIPSIDQATGILGPDPLDILQGYRANPRLDGSICLGMNCIVSAGAGHSLHIGLELDADLAF